MRTQGKLICGVAFLLSLISSPTIALEYKWGHHPHTLPTCADLATNPAYGLAANPAVTSVTTTQVPAAPAYVLRGQPVPATPTYCQVDFNISTPGLAGPAAGYAEGESQSVNIRVALPEKAAWVGRMMSGTGPGMQGSVGPWAHYGEGLASDTGLGYAIRLGYVGTTTDTGHGSGSAWGVIQSSHTLNYGKIADAAWRGTHLSVIWGKEIAQTYYGTPVSRNYWNGCSGGGWQGMGQLQRFGDEFDGFLIGAPAFYWQQFRLADAWPAIVIKKLNQIGKTLTAAQIAAANASATAVCDVQGSDVLQDGIVADTRACTFSAFANICGTPGAPAAPDCLDADQAAAIDRIWDGPRNEQGKRIWFPFDRGINFGSSANVGGSTTQVMQWNHADNTFSGNNLFVDAESLSLAGYPPDGITYENEAELGSNTTADYVDNFDPDLHLFDPHQNLFRPHLHQAKEHGTKIIHLHGTQDGAIRFRHSVDYYRRVAVELSKKHKADFESLQEWYRLYIMPGVGHCTGALGGGAGPSPVDPFLVLVNWVENGIAPDQILAKGGTGAPATRTRPLCPFPTTAIYDGVGDPNVASSFYCGGNLETQDVVCDSLRTLYKHESGGALDISNVAGQGCVRKHGKP